MVSARRDAAEPRRAPRGSGIERHAVRDRAGAAHRGAADPGDAGVAEGAPGHLVRHHRDGKSLFGVAPGARAAIAEVAEAGRQAPARREGAVVSEPPVHRDLEHAVAPARLHLRSARDAAAREHAHTIEGSTLGEHRVHARERARGEEAVRRGDRRVEDARVPQQLAHVARQQGVLDQERRDRNSDRTVRAVERRHEASRSDQSHEASAPGTDQRRGTLLCVGGRSDVAAIEPEGLREQAAHRVAHRLARHSAQQLAGEPTEGEGVVGAMPARGEPRRRVRERLRHVVPIADALGSIEQRADLRKAGPVREHVAHRDRVLAGLPELGPVPGDAILERDPAAVGEHVQRRCEHALGGREGHRHGVGGPGVALARRAHRSTGRPPCGPGGRRKPRRRRRRGAPAARGHAPGARSPARPCLGSRCVLCALQHPPAGSTPLRAAFQAPHHARKSASLDRLLIVL